VTEEPRIIVAEARDEVEAAIWTDALIAAGIPAASYARGVGAALGGASAPGWSVFPVVVDRGQLGAARTVIADLGGGQALAPYRDSASARKRQSQALFVVLGVVILVLAAALGARLAAG
jgi:hypothetical protein